MQVSSTLINASAQQLIAEFAKSCKVSKAKAEGFAEQLFATLPDRPKMGRKFSEGTLKLRQDLKQAFADHSFKATAKELSGTFNATPVEITNALIWLEEQGGVQRIDTLKVEGRRGKPATIWGNAEKSVSV